MANGDDDALGYVVEQAALTPRYLLYMTLAGVLAGVGHNVQHLQSNAIDKPSRVVITTIQRLYSILPESSCSTPARSNAAAGS